MKYFVYAVFLLAISSPAAAQITFESTKADVAARMQPFNDSIEEILGSGEGVAEITRCKEWLTHPQPDGCEQGFAMTVKLVYQTATRCDELYSRLLHQKTPVQPWSDRNLERIHADNDTLAYCASLHRKIRARLSAQ
jgi:hypothetical protein